jgi:vacuolar-type H+-ATPase catalytic subunit A/Vma1
MQVMLPPGARGTISYIAPAGEYTVQDEVIEIEFQVRADCNKYDSQVYIQALWAHNEHVVAGTVAADAGPVLNTLHHMVKTCPVT